MYLRLKKLCAKVFDLSNLEIWDLEYDALFKPMIACLKIINCVPTLHREPYLIIHAALRLGIFFLGFCLILYSTVFHDLHDDIRNLFANVNYVAFCVVISLEQCTILKYHKNFYNLMSTVKADYAKGYQLAREDQLILVDYAKRGKLVVYLWTTAVILYDIDAVFLPLMLMLYYLIFDEFKYVNTILLTLPPIFDDFNDGLRKFFVTVMTYSMMLYSSATYVAVFPQGLIYMLHACGRIDILKRKVLSLFPEDNVVPIDIHHSMKLIGKELQDVYDFVYDINITSGVIYEVTLNLSAVTMPVSALLIIEELKHTTVSLDLVILLASMLLFCSLPCYYGNLLMVKSMELRKAVFFCAWEHVWHKPTRKSLIIIMTRMQRTIAINSVFRVMNLETLADVFKTSYRLFSILSAAWTIEY